MGSGRPKIPKFLNSSWQKFYFPEYDLFEIFFSEAKISESKQKFQVILVCRFALRNSSAQF